MVVALVGVPLMAYLLASGLVGLWQSVRPPSAPEAGASGGAPEVTGLHGSPRSAPALNQRLSALAMAAMNLGMFWMSTGLLRPVAAWLDVLTF